MKEGPILTAKMTYATHMRSGVGHIVVLKWQSSQPSVLLLFRQFFQIAALSVTDMKIQPMRRQTELSNLRTIKRNVL